jgi:signal transduction histidine kinase
MADEIKILVVDDELGIREGCRRVLETEDYQVDMAADIQSGLQKIQENIYDLVLLDVMMPDGRGIDLLAPIIERDPDTIPIIVTGYATVEMAVEAIKAGAYDFISKPFTSDLLMMTVRQGLEKRRLSQETRRLQNIEREAAKLAKANEEMARLDEYKTTFMLTLAHELRSPVGGAQSLVRTVMHGLAGNVNSQQKEMLGRVNQRLDGLLILINDLLSLAASKTFDSDIPLAPLALQPIVRDIVNHFSVEASSKQVALTWDGPKVDLDVYASEDGLQKIIRNLVGNALKYTPKGGDVKIELAEQAGFGVVAVHDSGIGIPENAFVNLGEEFFRAPNARQSGVVGTGLGLSIVKQYVDHFGGELEIQSEVGEGSTFTVRLPLAA